MSAEAGAILAFDFGVKRIGVAVGDRAVGIAHPVAQITVADNRRRLEAIAKLVEEWRPIQFVVGIPSPDAAGDREIAGPVRRFAQRLKSRFGVPVDLVDEHLTSWESSRKLTAAGVRARNQKPYVDQLAACAILESWFDERRRKAMLGAEP